MNNYGLPDWPKDPGDDSETANQVIRYWESRCRMAVEALKDVGGIGPCALRTREEAGQYARNTLDLLGPFRPENL